MFVLTILPLLAFCGSRADADVNNEHISCLFAQVHVCAYNFAVYLSVYLFVYPCTCFCSPFCCLCVFVCLPMYMFVLTILSFLAFCGSRAGA